MNFKYMSLIKYLPRLPFHCAIKFRICDFSFRITYRQKFSPCQYVNLYKLEIGPRCLTFPPLSHKMFGQTDSLARTFIGYFCCLKIPNKTLKLPKQYWHNLFLSIVLGTSAPSVARTVWWTRTNLNPPLNVGHKL